MARGDLPYFNFYPSKFMTGIRGLTPAEVGVYTMLLCRIYEKGGPIEDDADVLSAWCGMRPDHFTKALGRLVRLKKFTLKDGILSNDRAQEEIEVRAKVVEVASRAGKASAQKRQQFQWPEATDVEQAFNHKIRIDKEREAKASPKKEPARRATRLPEDWALPRAWGVWAMDEEGMVADDVRREADRFKDYWHSTGGAKAAKLDWLATWKNWIRKRTDDEKNRAGGRGQRKRAFDATVNEIAHGVASGEIGLGAGIDDPFAA